MAQALLNRNLSSERPIAILSGNDLEHAVLGFAAYYAAFHDVRPAFDLGIDFVKPVLAALFQESHVVCVAPVEVGSCRRPGV